MIHGTVLHGTVELLGCRIPDIAPLILGSKNCIEPKCSFSLNESTRTVEVFTV